MTKRPLEAIMKLIVLLITISSTIHGATNIRDIKHEIPYFDRIVANGITVGVDESDGFVIRVQWKNKLNYAVNWIDFRVVTSDEYGKNKRIHYAYFYNGTPIQPYESVSCEMRVHCADYYDYFKPHIKIISCDVEVK